MNHIILVGFIGCGKGAAAKKLGISLALPVFDVDKMIAERMKMGVEEIFAQFGEVYYRALETQTLNHLMLLDSRSIIVLGSGLPTNPANDDYLKKLGKVYYLRSTKAALVKKIQKSKKHDWLKNDDMTEQINELLKEREAAYLRIADVEVLVDDLSSDEIAEQLAFYDREPEMAPVVKHEEKAAPKKAAKKTTTRKSKAAKAEEAAETEKAAEEAPAAEEKPKKRATRKKKAEQ